MRNCVLTLLLLGLVFLCGMVVAQATPALSPKNSIALTRVEGRMDHMTRRCEGAAPFRDCS